MKQGTKVKWTDGMGFEHEGIVDWEAAQYDLNPVPIRAKDGVLRWIERRNLTEVKIS